MSVSKGRMEQESARHDFASDNTAGICPEALSALAQADVGRAASYGQDESTAKLCQRVRALFETDCEVYLVFNGTAANALALAQLCQPFHSIVCHQNAHIQTDECGAPEFFTNGSKLLTVGGVNGKIDLSAVEAMVARQVDLHSHKPRVVSLTQSTEFGTVYSREEIAAVTEYARSHQLLVHMDGARFANAVAALNCAPKELTWQLGVDVLCFGGTKNGLAAGELVIFFRKALAWEFEYRAKQAGQLVSKMRFLAAPWNALLRDEIWLRNARHANAAAGRLANKLRDNAKLEVAFPVQANALFVRMDQALYEKLNERGWRFYKFIEPDIYRLMCSWSTTEELIDQFVNDAEAARVA
jgi:threonine aldolase